MPSSRNCSAEGRRRFRPLRRSAGMRDEGAGGRKRQGRPFHLPHPGQTPASLQKALEVEEERKSEEERLLPVLLCLGMPLPSSFVPSAPGTHRSAVISRRTAEEQACVG
ncbi:uncharacterized protein LRP34_007123 isoform 1-T1 [Phaethornis superciliosus]